MQKSANETGRAVLQLLLFFGGFSATAQTTSDSATVIAPGNDLHNTLPLPRSGKPFYDVLLPSKQGLRPDVLFSSDDRFYGGIAYNNLSRNWRTDSTGQKHKAYLHYSFIQKAFSIGYQGIFNRFIGNWNLFATAEYDWVKWTNFYGLGNETKQENPNAGFYRIRSREGFAGLGLQHNFGKQNVFTITPFYQRIRLLSDANQYFSQSAIAAKTPDAYDVKNFGGLRADVLLRQLNNLLLPTKGTIFNAGISHVRNLGQRKSFTNYSAGLQVYFPLSRHFVLSVENAAATVKGEPEFYQLNAIGGSTLRGFRRERFWGETVFHNNNELYYLFDAPQKLFRGKLGVLVFGDQGRVWKDGEKSDKWHYGYGGGVLATLHNRIYLSAQYGISNERKGFHFTFRRTL